MNSPLWAGLLKHLFLPPLFSALPERPARILEIGCGRGDTTRMLLLRFPAAEVVATDYDPAQVALAARRVTDRRLTVRQADATALPFPDSSFDLVIECNTFHHVARWEAAFVECARVLAPDGAFAVMDEDAKLFNPLFRWFDRPESLFTKKAFIDAAAAADLVLMRDKSTARIIRCVFGKT